MNNGSVGQIAATDVVQAQARGAGNRGDGGHHAGVLTGDGEDGFPLEFGTRWMEEMATRSCSAVLLRRQDGDEKRRQVCG